MKQILFASNNEPACKEICHILSEDDRIDIITKKSAVLGAFRKKRYDVVLIDIDFLRDSGKDSTAPLFHEKLQPYFETFPNCEIAVLTPRNKIREAVAAVKAGACFYLTYPLVAEEIKHAIEYSLQSTQIQLELDYLRDQFWEADCRDLVRTNSRVMDDIYKKVKSVAPTRTTVLITGETGTGKGVLSKLIHQHSHRRGGPFIAVHCGAIPENLLESELFGHEKGAFTGANRRKMGKFEVARGGTIFLDEISTMSHGAQIKVLQVLQDKIFQRVGGEETIASDVRIIAASNVDLQQLSDEGHFRRDLYYRLHVFPVEIPPLRERSEDIRLIAESFIVNLNRFHMKDIHGIHPKVLEAFGRYNWPGNIRELENLIERAYILETSSVLTPESFPGELLTSDIPETPVSLDTSLTLAEVRNRGVNNIERQYLKELLTKYNGSISRTARAADISTRQVHKLMVKHKLRKENFKKNS